MNQELKTILMKLPEAIVLVSAETTEVSLHNSQFDNIFKISDDSENLKEAITQKTMVPYRNG